MMFASNVLLAIVWAALIGPFTPANILVGFIVAFAFLSICFTGRSGYTRRVAATIGLIVYTLYELVVANLRVAYWTLTSLSHLRPAVLRVPLEPDLTDVEITILANLITLTPGTLTIDVASDRRGLFIHFMHIEDPRREIESIKSGFERRVLLVTRGVQRPAQSHAKGATR